MAHALGLLQDSRAPLESSVARDVIGRLRYFAHEEPDTSLRAAVHVACAYLSAGNREESRFALNTAAARLRPPSTPHVAD